MSILISASVLDRFNPLFEGAGILQLADKGMTKGGIDTVTPHDDFRIIFPFNPRYEELSRDMRNRGPNTFSPAFQRVINTPRRKLRAL